MRYVIFCVLVLWCAGACNVGEHREKGKEKLQPVMKGEPFKEKSAKAGEGPGEPAAAPAGGLQKGRVFPVGLIGKKEDRDPKELVQLCVKAMGGKEKLQSIKAVSAKTTMEGGSGYQTHHVVKYPDRLLIDYYSSGALVKAIIYDGKSTYLLVPGGITEMKEAGLKWVLTSIQADTIYLLQTASKPGARLDYLGETQVDGQEADVVKLLVPQVTDVTFFIDKATRMFLGSQYAFAVGLTTVVVSDYREVDGFMVAYKSRVTAGRASFTSTIDEVTFNPKIPPETFRPEKHPFYK
jgi:outer membrane lipoprotein-sorting protein